MVAVGHHDPSGQNADRSFEDTHMDVHFKAFYILAVEERFGEGDDCRIVGAKKLFHTIDLTGQVRVCRAD